MADKTGGPLTGGRVENEAWAREQIQKNAQQRQVSAQGTEQTQTTQAAPKESVQEFNDRVAERNAKELGEMRRQQALKQAKQALAPTQAPNQEQQLQQQKKRDGREM
jgi:hypothetical protein